MINRLKKSNAGFTLIELMIVVAIVGILSAIAIPNYLSYRDKGANAAAKTEARNYFASAMAEVADTGAYVAEPDGFVANPNVATLGTLVITPAGIITSTMTFKHDNGTITYTISSNGAITGA